MEKALNDIEELKDSLREAKMATVTEDNNGRSYTSYHNYNVYRN